MVCPAGRGVIDNRRVMYSSAWGIKKKRIELAEEVFVEKEGKILQKTLMTVSAKSDIWWVWRHLTHQKHLPAYVGVFFF
jgi:hypothetical protein